MNNRIAYLIIFLFITTSVSSQINSINLSGKWQVTLDSENQLVKKYPTECNIKGKIELPGSLTENGFGWKTSSSDFGILTPEYKYIGKAWYKKQIVIPENWKDKQIEIFLERVLWESRIFIDGVELSKQDALGTPHIHNLGKVSPGNHELTVLVDNEMIHNIGDKGHAYGEYTQSIWNGIVGKMELRAKDATHFLSTNIYSDIQKETITIKSVIQSKTGGKTYFKYEIVSVETDETILSGNVIRELEVGETKFEFTVFTEEKLKEWTEFNPETYLVKMYLSHKNSKDYFEGEFGFYQVRHNGTKLLVNGNPIFLRGNLDCVHFPLTGYVSCELDDWINIFKTYKDYGLNHARFHSWCPPEAAFKAASRVGIYLQAEASI